MYPAEPKPLRPTVKLFPRIAAVRSSRKLPRGSTRRALRANELLEAPEDARGQLRARLLRMILDNEQVRRNEHRPSAS
jgi:hypothetical protein